MNDISAAREIVKQKDGWLKSHGLGNDYIVFNAESISFELSKENVVRICDEHFGIGSDGILLLTESKRADFGLTIYNPDGSIAEKSGNGLRIFADYLFSMGYTDKTKISIEVGGQVVWCSLLLGDNGDVESITVDIGKATFVSAQVPVISDKREAIDLKLSLDDEDLVFSAVSVGNPHAVFIVDDVNDIDVVRTGSMVECHEIFPNRTNVQFVQVLDRSSAVIEIFERGAGYTLASGSSSCAVVAVLYKKGLVDEKVNVHMPGGTLEVEIDENYNLRLSGPVERTACGVLL
jgi:diaminopimelate epimerase